MCPLPTWKERLVRNHIEANLFEKMDYPALHRIAKLSPAQFNRAFKATFGMAAERYVLHRRIEAACKLLLQTAFPSYRVGIECGFFDGPHFSREFRKVVGENPAHWRKAHA